jgi:hypothetical protein
LSFAPSQFFQFLPQRCDLPYISQIRWRDIHENTDLANLTGRLRERSERPDRRCADDSEELAAVHARPLDLVASGDYGLAKPLPVWQKAGLDFPNRF